MVLLVCILFLFLKLLPKNIFFLNFYLFIYLFLAVLGLRFCARAFSSCGERGPLFITVCGPLTIAASLVAEHKLQTRRLSSCGSATCGIFPDQGSNPCPLHWQADSQPLRHRGSLNIIIIILFFLFYISMFFQIYPHIFPFLCFSFCISFFLSGIISFFPEIDA